MPIGPATHVLILGAGFSHGVVPLVNELMHETIGVCYHADQESVGHAARGRAEKGFGALLAGVQRGGGRPFVHSVEELP
jgi:hypothetical protein